MTKKPWKYFFEMTQSGKDEARMSPPASRESQDEELSQPPSSPLTAFFSNMKKQAERRLAAEDAGTWEKVVGIGGLVLLTSLFAPVRSASAALPDPALNEAFAVCMAHEGYEGARVTDVTGPKVCFVTAKEGLLSLDLAANTLTGKVNAWGENKQQFQIEYAGSRIETVLPDTALRQGLSCWRRVLVEKTVLSSQP